jgi:hypothetical protein
LKRNHASKATSAIEPKRNRRNTQAGNSGFWGMGDMRQNNIDHLTTQIVPRRFSDKIDNCSSGEVVSPASTEQASVLVVMPEATRLVTYVLVEEVFPAMQSAWIFRIRKV